MITLSSLEDSNRQQRLSRKIVIRGLAGPRTISVDLDLGRGGVKLVI